MLFHILSASGRHFFLFLFRSFFVCFCFLPCQTSCRRNKIAIPSGILACDCLLATTFFLLFSYSSSCLLLFSRLAYSIPFYPQNASVKWKVLVMRQIFKQDQENFRVFFKDLADNQRVTFYARVFVPKKVYQKR